MNAPTPSRSPFPRFLAGLGLISLVFCRSAIAEVVILGSSAPPYANPQEAVDAAQEGDTLILGLGSYPGFVIDGKGLTLRAKPGQQTWIYGQVEVRNILPGSAVRMEGLKVQGRLYEEGPFLSPPRHQASLALSNCDGALRFFRCEFRGGSGVDHGSTNPPPGLYQDDQYPHGGHGAEATDCTNLAFLDCLLVGGNGSGREASWDVVAGSGGHALYSDGSSTATYDSRFLGGVGGLGGIAGGDGGDGVQIQGFGMFASGSEFVGGDGGDVDPTFPFSSGNGGFGIWVRQDSHLRLVENTYSGGDGGCCGLNGGMPGLGRFWEGGTVNEMPGQRRSLRSTQSFVGDGETFLLTLEGQPGDRAFLVVATREWFQFTGTPPGVELVALPEFYNWGQSQVIGPSGTATWAVPAWELPDGTHRSRTAQAIVRTADGSKALGGAVLLTAFDDESLSY